MTINVGQIPRPPIIFAQNRSIPEDATAGALLYPALVATQPQGLQVNFSVSPTTFFNIQPATGLLYLQVCVAVVFEVARASSRTHLAHICPACRLASP